MNPMSRTRLILGFITVVLAWHFLKGYLPVGDNTMEYRGQTFRLAKYYNDYDDYKNDPHNLQESEIPRIEKIMKETRIGPTFKNLGDFNKAVDDLMFPGYGIGNIVSDQKPWTDLTGMSVEIPQRDQDRSFVVQKEGDHYRLIDDFVNPPGTALACKVKMEGNILRYYDYPGRLVREKKVEPASVNN